VKLKFNHKGPISDFHPSASLRTYRSVSHRNRRGLFLLCMSLLLCSCLDSMQQQDREFVAKIKEHLKHKGDNVRVSDIHPGEWTKVCFTVAGAAHNAVRTVAKMGGVDFNLVKVINRKNSEASHSDMFDWGIYFFYPPHSLEYFQIFNGDTYPSQIGAVKDQYGCARKEYAYFIAKNDQGPGKYRKNYLDIQLTEMEKGSNQ
jgi:hypothetical protein